MKYLFSTLLSLLLLSSSITANAVNIEGDISVTDVLFSGKGEITSFDVNLEGELLICVSQAYSFNKYAMIFQQDGTLLRTFKMRCPSNLYAMFAEGGNVVLYGARSSEATVFNNRGEILYEYSENVVRETSEARTPDRRYYGDIVYRRNGNKNQITRIVNGEIEVVYEISSVIPERLMFICFSMLFVFVSTMILLIHREKAIKRYKEGLERNRETIQND